MRRRAALLFVWVLLAMIATGCPSSSKKVGGKIIPDGGRWPTKDILHQSDLGADTQDDIISTACGEDIDCPEGQVCDPDTNICVACYADGQCPEGFLCLDNQCVDVPECDADTPCPEGLVCDEELGLCVECIIDGDCPPGFVCDDRQCKPESTPCASDVDCPPPLVCDLKTNLCVECFDDEQCQESQWCNLDKFACEADLCNPGDRKCVSGGWKECADNGSGFGDTTLCPEGTVCEGGECLGGPICEPGQSECVDPETYRICDAPGAWTYVSCPTGTSCDDSTGEADCLGCAPSCQMVPDNGCGPDGCGGVCDNCFDGWLCPDGVADLNPGSAVKCLDTCTCGPMQCGVNDCGANCGDCPPGYLCADNFCVPEVYNCVEGWACILGCAPLSEECASNCISHTQAQDMPVLEELYKCVGLACDFDFSEECIYNATAGPCAEPASMCLGCEPSCAGKECGPDGCGGSCGACYGDTHCVSGKCVLGLPCSGILQCVEDSSDPDGWLECIDSGTPDAQGAFINLIGCVQQSCGDFLPGSSCYATATQSLCLLEYQECVNCVPSCGLNQCGPDGCGGLCGVCPDGWDCNTGLCVCIPNCQGVECGFDGCGGVCGVCQDGFTCTPDGKCDCSPDCLGKECGNDGCGGTCGLCDADSFCSEAGSCIPVACNPGDTECDGNIQLLCSEDGAQWLELGPCPVGTWCLNGQCEPWICEPGAVQCVGNGVATCADNGAGWLEPESCPANTICQQGVCVPAGDCGDIPEAGCCDGNSAVLCAGTFVVVEPCGTAGCGWIVGSGYGCGGVGSDPSGQFPYPCPGSCEPQCDGKQCGSDGCGGNCGLCPDGLSCEDGNCVTVCVPDCQGKQCGTDGCGGECGLCQDNQLCVDGQCVVPPNCGSLLDCGLPCFAEGDACFAKCAVGAPQKEVDEFEGLWNCLDSACAATPTTQCANSALLGSCYPYYLACVSCVPTCSGKECGPDGCGGSCGACGDEEKCQGGVCVVVCVPDCSDSECGNNGCGGSCGSCLPGFECIDGICEEPCQPSCFSAECGPDGCGGVCGYCGPAETCSADGQCVPYGYCGDDICGDGESCQNCISDCGECSTGCEATFDPGCDACSCEDCVCAQAPYCCGGSWDDFCVELCFECGGCGCVPQCDGKDCGPDGCGGTCGECNDAEECKQGACLPICTPQCQGKECGSDGCGGVCGVCSNGATCQNNQCFSGLPCDALITCSLNCVSSSGVACIFDCLDQGTPEAQDEFFGLAQCILGVCGMNLDTTCMLQAMNNQCIDEYNQCTNCDPDCFGKMCGPDGCNGSCGTCPDGYYCQNYQCELTCTPQCQGKECGADGCGGTCGTCTANEACQSGQCIPTCIPSCTNQECGSDGCGGSCGECKPGYECSDQGFCFQVGPLCGDNECAYYEGESCVTCPMDCGPCGDGCVETPYPGCNGCPCEEFVCQMAPWCCEAMWDPFCVEMCTEFGACGCVPNCMGADGLYKECGPDGCGGTCGTCGPGSICQYGQCSQTCFPSCLGKQCGPDGCGGSCGTCPSGFICKSGMCEPSCVIDCEGKECGPDGCNGICGLCGPDEACFGGTCQTAWDCETLLNCAWDCADGDETCTDACWNQSSPEAQSQYIKIWECVIDVCGPQPPEECPGQAIWYGECRDEYDSCRDCTPQCTGKQCGPDGCGGTCGSCPTGYLCDEFGYCDCMASCQGKECGNDGCGGTCGECPFGYQCNNLFQCVCIPSCLDKECGSDSCGGSCGTCGPGTQCSSGLCQPVGPVCGDGLCEQPEESCMDCPQDCGMCQGDCCETHDEPGCQDPGVTACVCAQDPFCCQSYWDDICVSEVTTFGCGECDVCVPNCNGKQCGADGCGGSCGSCPAGSTCSAAGKCVTSCVPSCDGKQCGSNGCGGVCGVCKPSEYCSGTGQCVSICTPQCNGKQCGPDGCGGSCGTCPSGSTCNAGGSCVCQPNCSGKECGSDGCGGSCGSCGQFEQCTASGNCAIVTPLCGDNNCMSFIGENCDSCPQDCGACCGNGQCQAGYQETCQSCPQDCGACCGNGFCESQFGEDCASCATDCGTCPVVCGDGLCDEAKGESCESCPYDCGTCPALCGDGACDIAGGEGCDTCPEDCGPCQPGCGDGMCNVDFNENCVQCPEDCGPCKGDCCADNGTPGCQDATVTECVCNLDPFCCDSYWDNICASEVEQYGCGTCGTCIPNCDNALCGDDGCGGSCGQCPDGSACVDGMCEGPNPGLSCNEILQCAIGCGGGTNCIMDCHSQGDQQGQLLFNDLIICVLGQCPNFDLQCVAMAFMSSCSAEYQACQANN